MKKLILSLAVLMAAGTVSAQDKVVRKARDLQIEVQNLMANKQRDEKETAQMQQKMQQGLKWSRCTFRSVQDTGLAWMETSQRPHYTGNRKNNKTEKHYVPVFKTA
jgi:hypothetical protein